MIALVRVVIVIVVRMLHLSFCSVAGMVVVVALLRCGGSRGDGLLLVVMVA